MNLDNLIGHAYPAIFYLALQLQGGRNPFRAMMNLMLADSEEQ
jgi:hypothetical protein